MRSSRFLLTRSRNTCLISSSITTSTSKSKPGGLLIKDAPFHRRFLSGNGHPSFGDGTGYEQSSAGTHAGASLSAFTIFKGKAALIIEPFLPKYVKNLNGTSVINRKGTMFLKFMPAIGARKYDYQKKEVVALNATELGCLISLDPNESCEFVHDPSMKSGLEGQIKKTLNIIPIPSQNGGYFFNLTVNNSILKTSERFSLPVTKAEFTVMRTAFSFTLPHIMGWSQAFAMNQATNLQFQGDHHPSLNHHQPTSTNFNSSRQEEDCVSPFQLKESMKFNSSKQDARLVPMAEWEK